MREHKQSKSDREETEPHDEDSHRDLDIQMALLALSTQDMGGPTEALDLSRISDAEKTVLLRILKSLLGNAPEEDIGRIADVKDTKADSSKGQSQP